MIKSGSKFLVVDDDERFRKVLSKALRSRGFIVAESGSVPEALELVRSTSPTHIILDLRMPQHGGIETLEEIKKISSENKVLIFTGYGSIATAIEAVRKGACNYLSKPANLDQILAAFDGTGETVVSGSVAVPSLSRVEWEHIERVMADCKGNVSKASKLLGIHRRSLQRKLKSPPRFK